LNLSVEISMYPLNAAFIEPILGFIADLKSEPELTVLANTMSTQVFGPAPLVYAKLQAAMGASWNQHGKVVFVCKFVAGDTRELA